MLIATLAFFAASQTAPAPGPSEPDTRERATFECMTYPNRDISHCRLISVTPNSPELRARARRAAQGMLKRPPPGDPPPTDGAWMRFTVVLPPEGAGGTSGS